MWAPRGSLPMSRRAEVSHLDEELANFQGQSEVNILGFAKGLCYDSTAVKGAETQHDGRVRQAPAWAPSGSPLHSMGEANCHNTGTRGQPVARSSLGRPRTLLLVVMWKAFSAMCSLSSLQLMAVWPAP